MSFPIDAVRADFPILTKQVYGRPLVYLDSAATSQKPRQVIERLSRFYAEEYGTVRRGVYSLSQHATALYEGVRKQAASFLGAASADEIVFVRGVTEAMNLIATGWARAKLGPGDEIVVSGMEHHSNIVPWQLACAATGATLRAIPVTDAGEIDLHAYEAILREGRTRLVSVVHISNGLGTVNPVAEMARLAHEHGALFALDGAQSAPHRRIDVAALGCDFYACSGHKMLGPTGAGLLWARAEVLADMAPYQGGGEMIDRVRFEASTWEEPPHRFEAGTPAFADVIALGEAMAYLERLGLDAVEARDAELTAYAERRLRDIDGLRVIGAPDERSGLVPFVVDGLHPYDIGTVLDREGICIRVGQHCVQPLHDRFGLAATARASFGVYTTHGEIDALIDGLRVAVDLLR
jgi:cysteine desulfurase/selenocysteine lyase